jgi:subtilisin family serine protease
VDSNGDMPTTCASQFMVGVGRTDRNDNTAGGFGVINVDLGAPGIDVRTTANTNTYTTTTGTSFACPLTAGVIGLAYSIPCPNFMQIVKANPQTGAELVLSALYNGVDVKSQLATRFRNRWKIKFFQHLNAFDGRNV